MGEKVGKSRNTVFFPMICGSGGSKSRLAKAAGAEPSGQMRDEVKVHAVVARSTCRNQNVQNTPVFGPLLDVEKVHAIVLWRERSKCTKRSGPLLAVKMSKKCTQLWREAHFQVRMLKKTGVGTSFGGSDLVSPGRRKGLLCTLSQVSKTCGFCSIYNYNHHYTTHSLQVQYTTLRYNNLRNYTLTTFNYNTLHYTTLGSITLNYTSLHYTTLHYSPLHYTHYTTLPSTTLHYTTLHYTATTTTQLHSTTPHYTPLHNYTTLRYITLHYIAFHYTPLHYTPLHYSTLHSTSLHYITLHSTTLHYTNYNYNYNYHTTFTRRYTALHYTNYTTLH